MKHKHAHWIKIWADGEHVQWRNSTSFPWSDMLDSGNWDHFPETTQFRIRPAPYVIPVCLTLEKGIIRAQRQDMYAEVIPNVFLTIEDGQVIKVVPA